MKFKVVPLYAKGVAISKKLPPAVVGDLNIGPAAYPRDGLEAVLLGADGIHLLPPLLRAEVTCIAAKVMWITGIETSVAGGKVREYKQQWSCARD